MSENYSLKLNLFVTLVIFVAVRNFYIVFQKKQFSRKFDGLMIETHSSPKKALSDAKQQVNCK